MSDFQLMWWNINEIDFDQITFPKAPLKLTIDAFKLSTAQLSLFINKFSLKELKIRSNTFDDNSSIKILENSKDTLKSLYLQSCDLKESIIKEINNTLSNLEFLEIMDSTKNEVAIDISSFQELEKRLTGVKIVLQNN